VLKEKIVEINPIDVVYVRKMGDYMKSCNEAWDILLQYAFENNLMEDDTLAIGIGHDNPNVVPVEKLRCDACLSYTNREIKANGKVGRKTISGGKYATFLHVGPYENLQNFYGKIDEWRKATSLLLRDEPTFERYFSCETSKEKEENPTTEVYVAIL